ncbi:efflux RND transporter periplasmic adaptor subunit [Psychroflexus sp. ALD_RP9]|uniref:efflux RND transporter periplasmic adaptor subunit n=1 Tax=Psychroflexus sp. ALD_RP9 TaxID=2777186 RepID=UPI001A9086F1|nr:efflux RND transporter periplasmic adaptor subunit [Psychroflexus sp. ALD_RP9]QSS97996.1 efflux RND transporter periplasmic adaptor subunit [Psychroflexus sp. ALD_RP9]
MNNKLKTFSIAGLILVLGVFLGAILFSSEDNKEAHDHSQEQADETVWTCSMHPQIRKDEPGDCPICGMDLIPASSMEDDVDPDAIRMSKTARKLAQVETMSVGNEDQKPSMNFSGRLEINQDKTQSISANFKARIERLYVNEDGEKVQKGQVIAELYAPEIQVLKEELDLAKKQQNKVLLKAITQKIKNYELSVSDIQSLENGRLKLRSPKSGVISSLNVQQGDNLKADQQLMRIADLSTLWAIVDVYESDLNRIKKGDKLNIKIPNENQVTGFISFISPVLDDKTRTAKARVVIQNPNQYLKPGVFIKAKLENTKLKSTQKQTLMIPQSAVLWTGKRSVVYQELENENGIYFKMREVEIGKASSSNIEILSGLKAGDKVVVQGAFSIDSEAQLSNKPSMMNPSKSHREIEISETESSISNLEQLLSKYLELKNTLVNDDFNQAQDSFKSFFTILKKQNLNLKIQQDFRNIEALRNEFQLISEIMIKIVKKAKNLPETIYIQNCPMADHNSGADWLSNSDAIRNPYFGSAMLKCGSVIDSIQ